MLLAEQYSGVVDAKMSEQLGELSTVMDGRFSSVRTRETNLGNLVTDIMVAALSADCALLNSGTLRSDTEHPEGAFYLRVGTFAFTYNRRTNMSLFLCRLSQYCNILNTKSY